MLLWLTSPTKCCFWKGKEEEEKSFPAKRKEYKNKLKLWFNYWVIVMMIVIVIVTIFFVNIVIVIVIMIIF